jgi:murein DD-endopeptidase MepM/ murein hydrolase activator NlpD
MIAPVKKPVITSKYGNRIRNGKQEFHDGIDFISRVGFEVYAIADGVVGFDQDDYNDKLRWLDRRHSGGNMIIIKHPIHDKEYFIRYLHLVTNKVSVGQAVKEGDLIGIYGDTGLSQGAHLHNDMYTLAWVKIDPTPILNPINWEAAA